MAVSETPLERGEDLLSILKHTVGNDGFHDPGWRNYFLAGVGSKEEDACLILCGMGLMSGGAEINEGRDRYYYCTRMGCKVGIMGGGNQE